MHVRNYMINNNSNSINNRKKNDFSISIFTQYNKNKNSVHTSMPCFPYMNFYLKMYEKNEEENLTFDSTNQSIK